jgi:hypothetical protein
MATPNHAKGSSAVGTPDVTVSFQTYSKVGTTEPPRATGTIIPFTPLPTPTDNTGPVIERITTSSKGFAISDCIPTSITVTAEISDPSGVVDVMLWYRVGVNQPFNHVEVGYLGDDTYARTVKGTDMLGSEYGVWEFYLTAEDGVGNKSQSPVDTSVQLLPCVG